jgi:hypothetical protein
MCSTYILKVQTILWPNRATLGQDTLYPAVSACLLINVPAKLFVKVSSPTCAAARYTHPLLQPCSMPLASASPLDPTVFILGEGGTRTHPARTGEFARPEVNSHVCRRVPFDMDSVLNAVQWTRA